MACLNGIVDKTVITKSVASVLLTPRKNYMVQALEKLKGWIQQTLDEELKNHYGLNNGKGINNIT